MVLNDLITLSPTERAKFRVAPRKVLYPAYTVFYRFVTMGRGKISTYWVDERMYRRIYHAGKGSFPEMVNFVRPWLAVKESWSAMDGIYKIILLQPCHGWIGRAKNQPLSGYDDVSYMGNGVQVFLPGLKNRTDCIGHLL